MPGSPFADFKPRTAAQREAQAVFADFNPRRERYKREIKAGIGDVLPAPGTMGLLQRKISDPFGVQDELVGGGRYVGSLAGDVIHGRDIDWEAANRAYEEGAERVRAEQELASEMLGGPGSLAVDLVGGFGTMKSGAKAAATIALPLLQRIRAAAKAGAGYGAAVGLGHSEGDLSNRVMGAVGGAGMGAAAGPVLSEVIVPAGVKAAQLAKAAPSAVSNAVKTVIPGFRANINERLLRALRRQGMTPEDLAAQMAADEAAMTFRAGPGEAKIEAPLTLADTGPAMRELAYQVKAVPGEARTQAEALVEGRQRGLGGQSSQYGRMKEATRRSLRVTRDKAVRAEDKLKAGRGTAAKTAYDEFRAFEGKIPVDDILQAHAAEMADRLTTGSKLFNEIEAAYAPFADEVFAAGATQAPSLTQQARFRLAQEQLDKRIAKAAQAGEADKVRALQDLKRGQAQDYAAKTKDVTLTAPSYELSPAKFDAAKRQLYDMIKKAERDGDNYKASLLSDLHKRLVQRADEVTTIQTPEGPVSLYAKARESYATPSQVLDALEGGRGFLKEAPERVAQTYGALGSTPEKRAYRIGSADTMVRQFGSKRSGVNIADQIDTPNTQASLEAVAGPAGVKKLNAYADLETRMFQTRKRLMGGSPTEENRLAVEDFTLAARLGRKLKEGQVFGAAGDLIASTFQRIYRFREQDARLLARDLFSTDRGHQRDVVQRLTQTYGQRMARFAVSKALELAQLHLARTAVGPTVNNLLGFLDSRRSRTPSNALLGR